MPINEVPMRTLHGSVAIAATLLGLSSRVLAAIQLVPVVSSALSSPTFVGHAGDGSNRLFIFRERRHHPRAAAGQLDADGIPRYPDQDCLPAASRGLLGLAFHPLYEINGRFFVYYTRVGDGTLVLAEYHGLDRIGTSPTRPRRCC